MWPWIVQRLVRLVAVLVLISVGVALLINLVPGDPALAVLGPTATRAQYAQVHRALGLNQPVIVRYLHWVHGLLTGNLGHTLLPPTRSVWSLVTAALPVTLELAALAIVLAVVMAVPLGVWSAYRADEGFDRRTTFVGFVIIALPSFLLGLLLAFVAVFHPDVIRAAWVVVGVGLGGWLLVRSFARSGGGLAMNRRRVLAAVAVFAVSLTLAVLWPQFPREGYVSIASGGLWSNLRSVTLPVLTLALPEAAFLTRVLRNDMARTLDEDFVLASRAKGMPVRHILFREALRPSLFSLVTVAGISLGSLLGGTVIVETIFGLPGLGTLLVNSITEKDLPTVQACVLIIAALYVCVDTVVDLSYAFLDPRIRRGRI